MPLTIVKTVIVPIVNIVILDENRKYYRYMEKNCTLTLTKCVFRTVNVFVVSVII